MRADQPVLTGNAQMVTRAAVEAAYAVIRDAVRQTPVLKLPANELAARHPEFWLKLESLQVTGAFKARGALHSLLAADLPTAGVCAASGGNHGQAVAWAAQRIGVKARVFVPRTCPPIKLRRLADYGADVSVVGDVYDESLAVAQDYARQTGALLVHPFDQPLTIAGAGTVTLEFLVQVENLDTILVPVGGGGLLAGALAVLQETATKAVAVEPASARCLGAALDAGRPVDVKVSGPAVDSLGPRRVGSMPFTAASAARTEHVEVSDAAIVKAQVAAWEALRIGLEGGGATALAAILSGAYQPSAGERIGVLSSGGNVDIAELLSGSGQPHAMSRTPQD